MSQVEPIVFIFMCPHIQLYSGFRCQNISLHLQQESPEGHLTGRIWVSELPVSGVHRIRFICYRNGGGGGHDSGVGSEPESSSARQSLLMSDWESPSMGNAVQGDNYGGDFVLFSKLIFKATPEAHLLLLVWVLIKIQYEFAQSREE